MFREEQEKVELAVKVVLRTGILWAFLAYLALVTAATVFALLPPGLEGWAHDLAAAEAAHALRHGHASAAPSAEHFALGFRALLAAAWSSAAVLGLGMAVRWRWLLDTPQRWGT